MEQADALVNDYRGREIKEEISSGMEAKKVKYSIEVLWSFHVIMESSSAASKILI